MRPITGSAAVAAALLPMLLSGCGAPSDAGPEPTSLTVTARAGEPSQVAVVLGGDGARALRRRLGGSASREQVEELFSLAVRGEGAVPLLARLEWDGDRAVLVPQASLSPGLEYTARFEGPRVAPGLPALSREYAVPAVTEASPAVITAIHPRGGVVPSNLLKFYVHFSIPMAEGHVFRHARLLAGDGAPIAQPFHEMELWEDGHRRLTLLINPGRTKHALGLSEALGPVLEPERRYTLEIAAGLPDDRGRRLPRAFRHSFRTSAPDYRQPRIGAWRVVPPPAGTREPLRVHFGERLDAALAGRRLGVLTAGGAELAGTTAVAADGAAWSFVPAAPWQEGSYTLAAGGDLEDLAGNSLFRPFENAAGSGARPVAEPPDFRRPFRVGSARG